MVNQPSESVRRALHLSSEIDTATELLALGLNQVASAKWIARQPGGAFTSLAQGVERVLKLCFGLIEQSQGRPIGSKYGAGAAGHALASLHFDVTSVLAKESESAAPYVYGLLATTLADPYWSSILDALDRWAAASGRYRDLDALRGKTVQDDPPWAPWDEAEHRAVTEADGWANIDDAIFARARERMILSIMQWWHTIYRCWQHGLVGPEGTRFSSALSPDNLHLDKSIADLVRGR